ncbi:dTDP-4-dehydrorhamnose reductase [Prochlorococcus marinus]|uniref:dTDP-4-dehydrorhamnose reductase n=1 Tax=Prochlorococcus marinus TaxID=1219 RepID=UPI0022B428AE|nr:dTDP-4-dehydrorhamnose reductase [Prochlorococcus marinus]
MLKVLLTGATGQLGQALQISKPKSIELIALAHRDLDLSKKDECINSVKRYNPDWIINAGAYTAVDKAEEEFATCHSINAGAPHAFQEALSDTGGGLLQISTDYVFNGEQSKPYKPEQPTNPINNYGLSKAKGEIAALELDKSIILRSGWIYGAFGKNFLKTMLKIHANDNKNMSPIKIVSDQIGTPTTSMEVAKACWKSLSLNLKGKHILHWSNSGCASWYDFGVAIAELGEKYGFFKKAKDIIPIRTVDYPKAAKRPHYSVLDCIDSKQILDLKQIHWRESLIEVIYQFKEGKLSLD